MAIRDFASLPTVVAFIALVSGNFVIVAKGHAAIVEMHFQATIESVDDEEEGEARVGDVFLGTIIFDSNSAENGMYPNNFPGAIISFEIGIIPQQGPNAGAYIPQLSDTSADIFVGIDSIEMEYFVDIFTGNFQVILVLGPTFDNSLVTAGDELLAATQNSPTNNALDSFADPSSNSYFGFQNDYTVIDTYSVFDYVEFTSEAESCASCVGDVNGDGALNGLDVQEFATELTGTGSNPCADTDNSGEVTVGDIPTFVSVILTGGSC